METNGAPLVSICCDTYNHAPYIRRALDGFFMQQTSFPIEIIIHDDASTDGTADIVRAYEAAHPDVMRCVYREENMYSRDPKILEHYVFPLARGKYIAICEGDDYWTDPQKLQKQIDYMLAHPECTLCIHGAEIVDAEGRRCGMAQPYTADTDVDMDTLLRGGAGIVPTASIVTLTQLAKNRPAFCEMTEVDDAVLQLWFGCNGTTHYFSEPMSVYRYNVPGSWTETFYRSDRETRRVHHRGMIAALEAFDELTARRWHASVEYCVVHQHRYEILRLNNDIRVLRKPPYREQYLQLPLRRRVRMALTRLIRMGTAGGKQ